MNQTEAEMCGNEWQENEGDTKRMGLDMHGVEMS